MRERQNAEIAYQTVLTMVELEGTWLWQRWNYFLAAHALLFAGFAALLEQRIADGSVPEIVAALGILLSVCWWYVAHSGKRFYDMRVEQAVALERKQLGMRSFGAFAHGRRLRDRTRRQWCHWIPASCVTGVIVPWAFAAMWCLLWCLV
jgi:hypothetical protein